MVGPAGGKDFLHLLPRDFALVRDQWVALLKQAPVEADQYYFEVVLEAILPLVRARLAEIPPFHGLISLLGFSPETTVISCRTLNPDRLVVLHTEETIDRIMTAVRYCGIDPDLTSSIQFQHDSEHPDDIYRALGEALKGFAPDARVAIDLTGGKKTMSNQLAIATGILRQQTPLRICLSYVDYDDYLPLLRKPEPASTRLLLVDDPLAGPLRIFSGYQIQG